MKALLYAFVALLAIKTISCNEADDHNAEFQNRSMLKIVAEIRFQAKRLMQKLNSARTEAGKRINQIDVKDVQEVVKLRKEMDKVSVGKCFPFYNDALHHINDLVRAETLRSIFEDIQEVEDTLRDIVLPFCDEMEEKYGNFSEEQLLQCVSSLSDPERTPCVQKDYSEDVSDSKAHRGFVVTSIGIVEYLLDIDNTPSPSANLTKLINAKLRDPLLKCMDRRSE